MTLLVTEFTVALIVMVFDSPLFIDLVSMVIVTVAPVVVAGEATGEPLIVHVAAALAVLAVIVPSPLILFWLSVILTVGWITVIVT